MATTGNNARGFTPARMLGSNAPVRLKRYPTGSNARAIYIGDPVYLNADKKVQVFTTQASAGARPLLGVVAGVFNSNGRPFNGTADANRIGVSATGFVLVADDPDTVFVVQANASLGTSNIGMFATVSAGQAVSGAGRSGFEIDVTNAVNTAAGHPFQIIGLAPTELDELGGSNNDVEVRISHHIWRRQTRLAPFIEGADA